MTGLRVLDDTLMAWVTLRSNRKKWIRGNVYFHSRFNFQHHDFDVSCIFSHPLPLHGSLRTLDWKLVLRNKMLPCLLRCSSSYHGLGLGFYRGGNTRAQPISIQLHHDHWPVYYWSQSVKVAPLGVILLHHGIWVFGFLSILEFKYCFYFRNFMSPQLAWNFEVSGWFN